ncbi:PIR protein [Plasmodium ovale]|uniref:PIR Superfamily Protein n=2 Tax=Plasmodium ovale TaxID=36330 RepID=A0A1A8XDV7_PLAOA|nr:PIR Superfamily Protein [Plasmodium ovale curtisi]SBT02513.1 PIR Superfamily Protein [Plasmodium ovale curtisi]SBT84759.1 PIR protein [Plasmodium ovale]
MEPSCNGPSDTTGLLRCLYSSCSNGCFCNLLNDISRSSLNTTNENIYLNRIKDIDDPILRHISYYMVANYLDGNGNYNITNSQSNRTTVCQQFNRWLGERKHLFTYGGKCEKNEKLWKTHIDPLYVILESNNKWKDKAWCTIRPNMFENNFLNNIGPPPVCRDIAQEKCKNTLHSTPSFPIQQATVERHIQVPCAENNSSCSIEFYISLTICCTILGTFLMFFLLYKFTPFVPWLYKRRIKKKSMQRYINEEEQEDNLFGYSYDTSTAHFHNKGNYISYNSLNN